MKTHEGGGPGRALADMHVHPSLPWIGPAWRRRVQGFEPDFLADGPDAVRAPVATPSRLYGAVFYVTYMIRPAAARRKLFRSLENFRARFGQSLSQPSAAMGAGPPDTGTPGRLILTASDFEEHRARGFGDACFLAVESMRCLRDPGDVRRLWDLGVRSLQPIHFLDTPWGGSSREGMLPESRMGITGLGREMLAEMADLGLILDVAHMSVRNAEDCLAAYRGPVMCSHTGLSSIRNTARNVTPDLAREIFRRRGLVGVTCWRHLLGRGSAIPAGPGRDPARAAWTRAYGETVAALGELADHGTGVAVGSDRGAPILAPSWFYSPAHLAELEALLLARGWDAGRISGFFSGNAGDFLSRSLPAR
jgi:microsomal dipeptidase-like Zn-dependent dipeptidase